MATSIKIIDNKKVSMTGAEFDLYTSICRSYDRKNFKGEELFKNLFETDENGVIVFIKPPTTAATSIEVFFFIIALFQHQNMRLQYQQFDQLKSEMREALKGIREVNKNTA